jgi:phenylalanyl-tRNA synthetase beta chain
MRILLSWLRDFVEIRESPDDLADALTMAGMTVETVTEVDGETTFEMDLTSNRPDALNHFGMAREVAAIYRRPLKAPEISVPETDVPAQSKASVEILDPDLCPRYSARVLLGVEVKPSPAWMSRRLELCGIRSINNIADLTNYVLLELGHPTHAFDLDLLSGSKIVVRRAQPGEILRTLDGVDRTLAAEHLVIADARRPVALAGVMGGLETEISDSTRNVLIEAAWFQPSSVRRTARQFGMHTEASHRFERGADVAATAWAADRIAGLLGSISAGAVLHGLIDAYPGRAERPSIALRRASLRRLLGVDIPGSEVEPILRALGFTAEPSEEGWSVRPPSYRLDVEREIDLIEEVARIFGYDRFPPRLPEVRTAPRSIAFREEEKQLRQTARALGYDEIVSYSIISSAEAEQFGSWEPVRLKNPLNDLLDVMRNSAVPPMLKAIEWNLNRNESNPRLMEMGRLYRSEDGSYSEPRVMTLGASGLSRPASLGDPGKPLDFFDLKADVTALLAPFDLVSPAWEDRELPAYYQPGKAARGVSDGKLLARVGQLAPQVAEERKIRQPVFLAEIFLEPLAEVSLRRLGHRPLPRVPAVERDFSLLVPEGIRFAEIRSAVGRQPHLASLEPVEIFRGAQVPAGRYSLLLRAAWQKPDENFTDDEVNKYAQQIMQSLTRKLGIEQRT